MRASTSAHANVGRNRNASCARTCCRCCVCADDLRRSGAGAIPEPSRHHHRVARGRQRHGRAGAALCRQAVAKPRQAGGRRKSSRRIADACRQRGRDCAARRAHAARLDLIRDGDQSHAVQAGDLRSRSRLHPDLSLREVAVHSGGESRRAGEDGAGADRLPEGRTRASSAIRRPAPASRSISRWSS